MTKFLGPPVLLKNPCPLFVVRRWLRRAMVSGFMKFKQDLRHLCPNLMIEFALTTDNGPLTTDKWSGALERFTESGITTVCENQVKSGVTLWGVTPPWK